MGASSTKLLRLQRNELIGLSKKMEAVMEKSETAVLERELTELMQTTYRMEYELELVFQEANAR